MWKRIVTVALLCVASIPIAWFVVSAATGATLITFRTGSMAPTIPQGSVAVSVAVAAADIAVDDVVTVQREGSALPVTHRVIDVRPIPEDPDARELTLKGDDNQTADLKPYVITEARRVLFALPYVGTGLMMLQSPAGMGAMVLFAAAFTVWAFWPKTPQRQPKEETAYAGIGGREST